MVEYICLHEKDSIDDIDFENRDDDYNDRYDALTTVSVSHCIWRPLEELTNAAIVSNEAIVKGRRR